MDAVTLQNLRIVILFVVGVAGILVSVDKGLEAYYKIFRKHTEDRVKEYNQRIGKLEDRMTECETRISRNDQKNANIEEDNRQMLLVLNAMLMHMISGNDHTKLAAVKESLDSYLASRR